MIEERKFTDKKVFSSSLLKEESVKAFFTTRDFPLKAGERDDLIEEVEKNKKLLCKGLDIPFTNLFIPQQTHSDNVETVDYKKTEFSDCDSLITDYKNTALALNFADCVPILLYDPVKKVIAAAHAGWRGTVKKIGVKTAKKMVENFGSKPEDIIALIGPAIGMCCFDVKDDVKEKLFATIDKTHHSQVCENNYMDLKLINKLQLLDFGIKKIDVCEYCTSCESELFFSYRREKGKTARHSAVIVLK